RAVELLEPFAVGAPGAVVVLPRRVLLAAQALREEGELAVEPLPVGRVVAQPFGLDHDVARAAHLRPHLLLERVETAAAQVAIAVIGRIEPDELAIDDVLDVQFLDLAAANRQRDRRPSGVVRAAPPPAERSDEARRMKRRLARHDGSPWCAPAQAEQ